MTVQEQQNVESGLPAPEVNSSENRKFKVDDGGALAGLRGYAAIYIMVFHSLYYCTFHLNLHASVSKHNEYNTNCLNLYGQDSRTSGMFVFLLLDGLF